MVWPWKIMLWTVKTCAELSGVGVTIWMECATPFVRLSEKPIGSVVFVFTGRDELTGLPSTSSLK